VRVRLDEDARTRGALDDQRLADRGQPSGGEAHVDDGAVDPDDRAVVDRRSSRIDRRVVAGDGAMYGSKHTSP